MEVVVIMIREVAEIIENNSKECPHTLWGFVAPLTRPAVPWFNANLRVKFLSFN